MSFTPLTKHELKTTFINNFNHMIKTDNIGIPIKNASDSECFRITGINIISRMYYKIWNAIDLLPTDINSIVRQTIADTCLSDTDVVIYNKYLLLQTIIELNSDEAINKYIPGISDITIKRNNFIKQRFRQMAFRQPDGKYYLYDTGSILLKILPNFLITQFKSLLIDVSISDDANSDDEFKLFIGSLTDIDQDTLTQKYISYVNSLIIALTEMPDKEQIIEAMRPTKPITSDIYDDIVIKYIDVYIQFVRQQLGMVLPSKPDELSTQIITNISTKFGAYLDEELNTIKKSKKLDTEELDCKLSLVRTMEDNQIHILKSLLGIPINNEDTGGSSAYSFIFTCCKYLFGTPPNIVDDSNFTLKLFTSIKPLTVDAKISIDDYIIVLCQQRLKSNVDMPLINTVEITQATKTKIHTLVGMAFICNNKHSIASLCFDKTACDTGYDIINEDNIIKNVNMASTLTPIGRLCSITLLNYEFLMYEPSDFIDKLKKEILSYQTAHVEVSTTVIIGGGLLEHKYIKYKTKYIKLKNVNI